MTKSTITRERLEWLSQISGRDDIEDVDGGEIRELARAQLAAMDSEPAIADCDPEVYEKGISVCLVAIPKETAEVICQNITAATGCKVDWHYFGGRVHIKAFRVTSQPVPVVPVAPDEMTPEKAHEIGDFYGDQVDVFARGANWMRQHIIDSILAAAKQEIKK